MEEIKLGIVIPTSLHLALKRRALNERKTVRELVLEALKDKGFNIPVSMMRDRRGKWRN